MKRIISMVLIFTMLLSAGCGSSIEKKESAPGDGVPGKEEQKETSAGTSSGEKAMGRYIEEENATLTENLTAQHSMFKMEEGKLVIWDLYAGKWVSEDEGETWNDMTPDWYRKIVTDHYIMDVKTAPNGTVGIIYSSIEETNEEDSDETEQDEASADEDEGRELDVDVDFTFQWEYLLVAPDGTEKELKLPADDMSYIYKLFFSKENRLFGSAMDGKIYEVNQEEGTYEVIAEMEGLVFYLEAAGSTMICVNADGVTLLDLNTKEVIEDKVLEDFITANIGKHLEYSNNSFHTLMPLLAEDNILYLIFEKGIYRHVIGGNAVEQMVDGSLSSLGNPSYGLSKVLFFSEDSSFLILFANGSLIRYVYDPDTPTVPENQLKAYSLMENNVLKKTISTYQSLHPDVYIKYEVGMGEDSSVTREDALKKLNTELAAGTGPDIMVLDDMPVDSYKDKGILLDLSPFLNELKEGGDYFENILYALQSDTGTYAVPAEFKILLMLGKEADISKITNLTKLADAVEQLREENPEGSILGLLSEEDLIYKLLPACAPAWLMKEKQLDTNALTDFFTQCKRIWEAERSGLSEEDIEKINKEMREWTESTSRSGLTPEQTREFKLSIGSHVLDYLIDEQRISIGTLNDSMSFDTVISAFKIKGKTDSDFISCNGQTPRVYIPGTMLGINAKSENIEKAEELIRLILEDGWSSYSVNKKMWKDSMVTNMTSDGEAYGSMGVVDSEGASIVMGLDIYPASEEETSRLEDIIEAAQTPYLRDSVLEDVVCESGIKILSGEKSTEEGVAEIKQKLAIYLSE